MARLEMFTKKLIASLFIINAVKLKRCLMNEGRQKRTIKRRTLNMDGDFLRSKAFFAIGDSGLRMESGVQAKGH